MRADRIGLGGAQGEPDDEHHVEYEYADGRLSRTLQYSVAGYILREVKIEDGGARATYWDGEGRRKPLADTQIYSASLTRDSQGRIVELAYFDRAGAPTTTLDGVYRERFVRDIGGFPIARQAFDVEGNRAETDDGEFARETSFDEWGYPKESAYVDTRLEPVAIRQGYQRLRITYDQLHRRRGLGYFGVDGQLVRDRVSGCKIESRMYDKEGFTESDACADGPKELRPSNEGYTIAFFDFDRNGLMVRREYRSGMTQLAEDSSGISRITWERRPGSVTKFYFDATGNTPLKLWGGLRTNRNAAGRVVEEVKVGHDGRPWPFGVTLTSFEWDRGTISSIHHFDVHGAPTEYLGIASETIRRDTDSVIAEWKCFDAAGAPVEAFAFRLIRVPVLQPGAQKKGATKAARAQAPTPDASPGAMPEAEAMRFVGDIRQEVAAGKLSFRRAFRKYDPKAIRHGWTTPHETHATLAVLLPEWVAVLGRLKPGEISQPTRIAEEVVLVERTR